MNFGGLGVSPGVAAGKARLFRSTLPKPEKRTVTDRDQEWSRFEAARDAIRAQLGRLRDSFGDGAAERVAVLDAHLMILSDPEIEDSVRTQIQNDGLNAEHSVQTAYTTFEEVFTGMDNPYFRERAADVRDMRNRLIAHLLGIEIQDLSTLTEKCVLVADDLPPSASASLDPNQVIGIVAETGGETSHMAILARSLGIPAVTGVTGILERLRGGDLLALNGTTGEVELHPSETSLARIETELRTERERKVSLARWIGQPSRTADGHRVQLLANIGSLKNLEAALNSDAEGIGLFRTEFLFMEGERSTAPTEDEQLETYQAIVEKMHDKKVVIRTLDVGGDKGIPFLPIPKEDNPFLGMRAIRYCLKNPAVFKPQLRALLRASAFGDLGIMIPMVTTVEEVVQTRAMLQECMRELDAEGKKYSPQVQLGIMIEVPSAALIADLLVEHCDFFSIGTNDLTQYTCAVDRMNASVSPLYDQRSVAVHRLIRLVVQAAAGRIPVSVCGEMGGNPEMIPVLVGLGISQLSMTPARILEARQELAEITYDTCRKRASEITRT